ncbi:hypothetical protein DA73_0400005465 [Tolypothrix bouteillei VB521301]|uniref:Uncharacterized protein n=1 Tax=Tolypothrix bouteillei VB521301 TaxID=1479485 RepID=A0A0C1R0C0_9CYAN|nr:hypothetical protein DA73_0400005465 [Tolypothrix bouteillei VB521301]
MVNLVLNLTDVLAQVNFGANSASVLGIVVYFAGTALCSLPLWRPHLARYYDILFAQLALICSLILVFQGWRLDPILQFGQLLLVASAIFSTIECIRLR